MPKHDSFTIRPATSHDRAPVLTLNVFASNARAIAVYEKAAYRADFVRYVKLMSP
jgi:hypothetical protein